jgi:hypothetical protein
MMKLLPILLLLIVCCALTIAAQEALVENIGSKSIPQIQSTVELQLTTSIIEQNYRCPNSIGFKLRLTFKNTGSESVILDKNSFVLGRFISRDETEASAKRFEINEYFDIFDGEYLLADPSEMSNFVILKPAQDFSIDDGIGSFSVDNGASNQKGLLRPGSHVLQVEVNTWTHLADAKLFQRKWKDKGFLWAQGLISQPMAFTVESTHKFENCNR